MKQAEESAGASALPSGRETRASITCKIELLDHFCTSDPQQMDGETVCVFVCVCGGGEAIQQHLGSSITSSTGGCSDNKRKIGAQIPGGEHG